MNIPQAPAIDVAFLPQSPVVSSTEPFEPSEQEIADVKKWTDEIKRARDFDAPARAQYALDRSYARGSAGRSTFEVTTNIAGTYIDILVSYLYANDPAADVLPSESAGAERMPDARKLGKTLQPVIADLWRKGKLKRPARKWVRSALTIGIGWFKATWHENAVTAPLAATRDNDLQDNAAKLAQLRTDLATGECEYPEQVQAEIQRLEMGMNEQQEVAVSRRMVIDFVAGEDMTIPSEVAAVTDYLESPWLAHRTFLTVDNAKAVMPRIADVISRATTYTQVKPKAASERADPGVLSDASAEDADTHKRGMGGATECVSCICVHEIWNKETNTIMTLVEGLDRWGREPYSPDPATERWYPFFQWAPIEVDGDRHPQSLVARSASQLDEYNRIRSNLREHRRRAIPKSGFDRRTMDADQAKRLEGGGIGEMIGFDLKGDADPSKAVFPVTYPSIDAALYDTSEVRSELEMLWGIQEALSSTIRTAKTLGEAEIQQSGTEARTSFKRDSMEEALTDLGQYTAEVALQKLTRAEVLEMAGPDAFWPKDDAQRLTIADLAVLVTVEIRAGSSGKPNTTERRQAWGQLLPVLTTAITQIAALRGSSPLQVADCMEQLVIETVERYGDRIDPTRFIPTAPASVATDPLDPLDPMAAAGAVPPDGAPPAAGAAPVSPSMPMEA